MPNSHYEPAHGTVPASSTLVPGLQLSAVLGLGFVGAILVLDGGHSFDTCRSVGTSGLGGCATLWANLAILAVVIALVLLPVTMTLIRATRLRRHQAAPRLICQPTRQAWSPAPLPPVRPRFVAPPAVVPPAAPRVTPTVAPFTARASERSIHHLAPPGPSYIQPLLSPDAPPTPRGGADLDLLRRDFQALKAQLDATEPSNAINETATNETGGEVVAFHRPVIGSAPRPNLSTDEPTPA